MAELKIDLNELLRDAGCSPALLDVARERLRQVTAEGWTPEHDDQHTDMDLSAAAGCYAMHVSGGLGMHDYGANEVPNQWPFEPAAWKPKDERRDLIRAAALILAEIERIDRLAP
jgi:hypothetical protein